MSSSIGISLSITSFGESHGPFIGIVLDGLPAGIQVDMQNIERELSRRRPASSFSTERVEPDPFQIVSGLFENQTTGTPLCILIPNKETRSSDYEHLKDVYRPGHADKVYDQKYGIRDHRGGGRSSARITAAWVAAGAIARQWLRETHQIEIVSAVSSIGNVHSLNAVPLQVGESDRNELRCQDESILEPIRTAILNAKEMGETLGGSISTRIINCPPGIGEPVFGKLNSVLSAYIFSINAVKGIEFGSGFKGCEQPGSEYNKKGSQNEGGINGGISTGEDITFHTAFKPVSGIQKEVTAEIAGNGKEKEIKIGGRHDVCVLPRATPIVEAMTALAIMDLLLIQNKNLKK